MARGQAGHAPGRCVLQLRAQQLAQQLAALGHGAQALHEGCPLSSVASIACSMYVSCACMQQELAWSHLIMRAGQAGP